MNSEQRRAARRARREAARAEKRAARLAPCTMEAVAGLGALADSARLAARGVGWKASVQRYRKDTLRNAARARRDLLAGAEIHRGFTRFDVRERGKVRHIAAVRFPERVVHKSLTRNALVPAIEPSLIGANSANRAGRGTAYAVKLLKRQLARHHRAHGDAGWVLLVDFSDYFGRIDHGAVKSLVRRSLDDPALVELACHLVDVQGDVGLGLGSEPNQVLAVALPNRIDHYVTEIVRPGAYGRYMDDSYLIDADKAKLRAALEDIRRLCAELGIVVNERKTRIVKLTRGFTFLKKRFSFGGGGKVIVRPCKGSIVRERRRLKAMRRIYLRGGMTREQAERSYQSWRGSMRGLDAHGAVLRMDALFAELFGGNEMTRPEPPGAG